MIKNCDFTTDAFVTDEAILGKPESVCAVSQMLALLEIARELGCGKGTVCRDGITQLHAIVHGITRAKHSPQDLELLTSLLRPFAIAADCPMADEAIRKLALSLDAHGEEWSGHVLRKRCPALMCPGHFTVYIDPDKCTGCGECMAHVPAGAIEGGPGLIHIVRDDSALKKAFPPCPADAFAKAGAILPKLPEEPVPAGSFCAAPVMRRRRRGGSE